MRVHLGVHVLVEWRLRDLKHELSEVVHVTTRAFDACGPSFGLGIQVRTCRR